MAELLTYRNPSGQTFDVGIKAINTTLTGVGSYTNAQQALSQLHEWVLELRNAGESGEVTWQAVNEKFVTKTVFQDTIQALEVGGGSSTSDRVVANDFKTSSNTWAEALQDAFDQAQSLVYSSVGQYPTVTGSQLGLASNVTVTINRGVYEIAETVNIPYGVNFDFSQSIFKSTAPVQIADYDCLRMVNNCYHNEFKLPTFVGFRQCFVFSTANRDTSIIDIDGAGGVWLNCKGGVSDVNYLASRSTQLNIHNFSSVLTDQPIRTHCDDTHIYDFWISSSGYNGSAILSQSRLKMDNGIMIPKPMVGSSGDKACWVECYTETMPNDLVVHATGQIEDLEQGNTKTGYVGANNRAISIEHCVFGGESGSMPAVRWRGKTATNLSNSNALHNHIKIINCSIEVGNTAIVTPKSPIAIHNDLPSGIYLEGLNGLSAASEGLISMMSGSSNLHKDPTQQFRYEIYLGPMINGRESYPVFNDSSLYQFVTVAPRLNAEIPTFKALREAKANFGSNQLPPITDPDPEEPEVPVEDREPIRYIRLGGNQPDGDFKIGELEVWHSGTNILAGRQDWTVPEGTSRNLLPPVTDGVREYSNIVSINNDSDRSKQYIQFDLNESYAEIEKINFLLYPSLAFNVFLQVSTDGSTWRTVYTNPSLNQAGDMLGTDVHANALYAI